MNTKNNKRRRASVERIEKTFVEILQTREIEDITVSELCTCAGINRSTFYANFTGIYDLGQKVVTKLWENYLELYEDTYKSSRKKLDFTRLFIHIYENQAMYKTYYKIGGIDMNAIGYDKELAELFVDSKNIDYHIEFFRSGLEAIIKKWLNGGCKESPAEMQRILADEYRKDLTLLERL